jgi:PAS domain S-box-containing protein
VHISRHAAREIAFADRVRDGVTCLGQASPDVLGSFGLVFGDEDRAFRFYTECEGAHVTGIRHAERQTRRSFGMASESRQYAGVAASFDQIANLFGDCALLQLDPDGRVRKWSAGAKSLFGYPASEIVGTACDRLWPDGDGPQRLPELLLQRARTDGHAHVEAWQLRRDGSRFRANLICAALPTCFMVRIHDVWAPHELLVEGVRDYAIFSLDPHGHVTSWNQGARLIKGYEAHEIIGSHFSKFYPPDAIARKWPEYELRTATTEGRFEDEGWRIRKDGSRFWANVVITALRDSHGTLLGFSKITRDLSERHEQAEVLRQSEERFRLLLEGLPDYAILILDANGRISSWNSGAQRIFGYSAEEMIWKHVSNLYRPDEITASVPWHELNAARDSGMHEAEAWRVRKDGEPFWAKVRVSALVDAQGAPYGYAHVTHDLTPERQRRALEQLTQEMGEFVDTIGQELHCAARNIQKALSSFGRSRSGLQHSSSHAFEAVAAERAVIKRLADELRELARQCEAPGTDPQLLECHQRTKPADKPSA